MRTMRSMLKEKDNSSKTSPAGSGQEGTPGLWFTQNIASARPLQQSVFAEHQPFEQIRHPAASKLWPDRLADYPELSKRDVVDRGLLSMATARQLYETYETDLFPHWPPVPIPANMSADDMRVTRPALFLAIIAAAAGKENSELAATLDKEVLDILMQSEKSLDLIQALLLSAVWYHPPSKFGQLKYYEYIHMAATMAMDIGIGTRPTVTRSRFGNADRGREPAKQAMVHTVHPAEDTSNPDLSMTPRSRNQSPHTGSLESRRTFVATYMICAGVSLSLRRPNMLRISSYVRECITFLARSPDALSTDRLLVYWARLVVIAEEISVAFSYDDLGGVASITELRVQLMLKDFGHKLNVWAASVPVDESNGDMMIMYWFVRLCLHEVALHVDHSPEDFIAPYQMGPIQELEGVGEIPTQILAECISECISSSHALLECFFTMPPESLRAMPVFSYVRVSFAAFVLAKLCLSASHTRSRIGRVLDKSALKADSYMDRAVLHVRNIVGTKRSRVPAIFLALLFKLRQWCLNPEMLEQTDGSGLGAMEPYNNLRNGGALPETTTDALVDDGHKRITELYGDSVSGSASSETSPGSGELPKTQQASGVPSRTTVSEQQPTPMSQSQGDTCQPGTNDAQHSQAGIPSNGPEQELNEIDLMQLDLDFANYIDELNGSIGDGDLTGLDNWLPTNIAGITVPEDHEMVRANDSGQSHADTLGYGWIWDDTGAGAG
ncbi:hypothetical protein LTR86_000296 [Recurvomyces mirabilis]|nr:hypothetical protein LTR86_000296 [Recurvomyces mirabilis]